MEFIIVEHWHNGPDWTVQYSEQIFAHCVGHYVFISGRINILFDFHDIFFSYLFSCIFFVFVFFSVHIFYSVYNTKSRINYKADEITILQADALLMSHVNIIEKEIDLATIDINSLCVDKDTIRVGQLFNRVITLLWDAFMVCGLKKFIVSSTQINDWCFDLIKICAFHSQRLDSYDGPYFTHLLHRIQQSKNYYSDCRNRIHTYRLYADGI